MAYVTAEARRALLDTVAEATDELGIALTALGEAYDQLDEDSADRLEEQLFRPVQHAYGRAKRTHSEFAARHRLSPPDFRPAAHPRPSTGVKGLIDVTVAAVEHAEDILVELQDSMSPVEVGDAELRAGLAEVRATMADLVARAERFASLAGRKRLRWRRAGHPTAPARRCRARSLRRRAVQ